MSDLTTRSGPTGPGRDERKCVLPWCRHAHSRHNDAGYCQSPTTPNRVGPCICDGTSDPRSAVLTYGNRRTVAETWADISGAVLHDV